MGSSSRAYVLRYDAGVYGFGGKPDGDDEVGLGEPVAAEIPSMDDAGDLLAAGNILHADVVGFSLENESVHGVALGRGRFPMLLAGRVIACPCHSVVSVLPSAESLPRIRLG